MATKSLYYAVNTKILAMFGKLLKDDDYKKIIQFKTPSEIAAYLRKSTFYGEFLDGMDDLKREGEDIERALKYGLINYMDKLMHYFTGEYRDFFKCFYIKYEIYDLKKIARLIHIDKDFKKTKENLIFAGKYKYINVDQIIKSKSMEELIRGLEGTIYYPFVENLIDGNKEENLFRFEMALDRAYFTIVEDKLKKLSKADRDAFYKLYGCYIDMLNIQIIYRGKKYYKLSPEEIFNYTISRGYKYNYSGIKRLCYLGSDDEFKEEVKGSPYGFIMKGDTLQDIYMERRINRYMYFKLKSAKGRFNNDITTVLAFLEFIEFQVRDIISIIEKNRYEMDVEETKNYLIKTIQTSY